ncbi:MAG: hypothetical protein ACLST1_11300 [[Eubacterium] siraeum]
MEHSAVFGGEKSAVTVAKKDSQRAFFSAAGCSVMPSVSAVEDSRSLSRENRHPKRERIRA